MPAPRRSEVFVCLITLGVPACSVLLGGLRRACTVDQLAGTVRNQLQRIQHRPDLITGFLAQTGLTLEPEPP